MKSFSKLSTFKRCSRQTVKSVHVNERVQLGKACFEGCQVVNRRFQFRLVVTVKREHQTTCKIPVASVGSNCLKTITQQAKCQNAYRNDDKLRKRSSFVLGKRLDIK